jgi:hypothetical protein
MPTSKTRREGASAARIVCASPAYLDRRPSPKAIDDLSDHDCVTFGAVEILDDPAYETCADPAAGREFESGQRIARLRIAIAGLPESQREALELLKLREMSLAEASRASGKSVAALKVNVNRAINTLRARSAEEVEEWSTHQAAQCLGRRDARVQIVLRSSCDLRRGAAKSRKARNDWQNRVTSIDETDWRWSPARFQKGLFPGPQPQ